MSASILLYLHGHCYNQSHHDIFPDHSSSLIVDLLTYLLHFLKFILHPLTRLSFWKYKSGHVNLLNITEVLPSCIESKFLTIPICLPQPRGTVAFFCFLKYSKGIFLLLWFVFKSQNLNSCYFIYCSVIYSRLDMTLIYSSYLIFNFISLENSSQIPTI